MGAPVLVEPRWDTARGLRLRQARLECSMTQQEAAARIGVSRTRIWRWESGRATIVGAHLERAARVYRVSQKWILHGPPRHIFELQERLETLERAVDAMQRRQAAIEDYLGIDAAVALTSASGRR